MIQLRAYQEDNIERIRHHYRNGVARVCYQLPTGGGKTIVFCWIVAEAAKKGSRVLILAHRNEILEQISRALDRFGIEHGIIAAGYDENPSASVRLASVFTLARRSDKAGQFDLVIVDECHHAVASTWRDILKAMSDARSLGVTATPLRLDGKGLSDIYDVLVTGPTVRELIELEHLAPFVAYGQKHKLDLSDIDITAGDYRADQLADVMSDSIVISTAVSEYRRLSPGKPSIAFCVNIAHSRRVTRAFQADGWRAAHVDGETPRELRRKLISDFANGKLDVLSNCGLISEGLDIEGAPTAILLRPTMSLALYLQQVGRVLRPGKPRAVILDHAGCIARHGLPDHPHNWTLEGRPKGGVPMPKAKQCEHCGTFNLLNAAHCIECGTAFVIEKKPVSPPSERFTELTEIIPSEVNVLASMPREEAWAWAGRDRERLKIVAKARGYKLGWVWYRMQEPIQKTTAQGD